MSLDKRVIREVIAPIRDATATPKDVVQGKIFYNNDGRQAGSLFYKNPLILADNVKDLAITTAPETATLRWTVPESEIEIKHLNIYMIKQDAQPTDLGQFQKVATVPPTTTEYTVNGLEKGKKYFFVIESVSIEDYENASMRGVRSATITNGLWLASFNYNFNTKQGSAMYYSDDGEKWKEVINDSGDKFYFDNGVFYLIYVGGKFYNLEYGGLAFEIDIANLPKITRKMVGNFSLSTPQMLSHDGQRFVVSYNTGNSMRYWYQNGIEPKSTGWIALAGGPYGFGQMVNNGMIVVSGYVHGWSVYDFDNPVWQNVSSRGSDYTESMCYGLGKYVVVGRNGTSCYILEESIKRNESVSISYVDSNDWDSVVFAKDWNMFFASKPNGIYYLDNNTNKWVSMNRNFGFESTLSFSNGRLICALRNGQKYYCINKKDFIGMGGQSMSTDVPWTVCGID